MASRNPGCDSQGQVKLWWADGAPEADMSPESPGQVIGVSALARPCLMLGMAATEKTAMTRM